MCQFCHKHGEGKKWYLQAKNYSDDLLSDIRRRKFIEDFFTDTESLGKDDQALVDLDRAPGFVKRVISRRISNKMKKVHYGQVLPLEDIECIFEFVNSFVRISCICRHVTLGNEQRYCYCLSLGPNGGEMSKILRGLDESFLNGPESKGLEELSKEETLDAFKGYEKEGLCHSVWTFHAPFISGICNCDRVDCIAMRATVTHGVPVMFRAEYIAQVSPDLCNGCKQCMRVCQFGAIAFSVSNKKAAIDKECCYGCGICRSVCSKDAIQLKDRNQDLVASRIW